MRKALLCLPSLYLSCILLALILQLIPAHFQSGKEISQGLIRSPVFLGNRSVHPNALRGRNSPSGLPSGRAYYQGRYYGNPGNRFYGPQYGYF